MLDESWVTRRTIKTIQFNRNRHENGKKKHENNRKREHKTKHINLVDAIVVILTKRRLPRGKILRDRTPPSVHQQGPSRQERRDPRRGPRRQLAIGAVRHWNRVVISWRYCRGGRRGTARRHMARMARTETRKREDIWSEFKTSNAFTIQTQVPFTSMLAIRAFSSASRNRGAISTRFFNAWCNCSWQLAGLSLTQMFC
jgi:hypothetical protein